jgi:putative serine protease PepD
MTEGHMDESPSDPNEPNRPPAEDADEPAQPWWAAPAPPRPEPEWARPATDAPPTVAGPDPAWAPPPAPPAPPASSAFAAPPAFPAPPSPPTPDVRSFETRPIHPTEPIDRTQPIPGAEPLHQAPPEPAATPWGEPSRGPAAYEQAPYGQAPYGQAAYEQSSFGQPPYGQPPSYTGVTAGPMRTRSGRGLPSLLLVAVVAAAVGAGVAGGIVAATKKTTTAASSGSPLTATSAPSSAAASLPAGSVAAVAQSMLPSVVSIIVTSTSQEDEGTGIILTADGQILTNNHVVETAATSHAVIAVTFNDGRTVGASIVGRDPTSDLAVIKANGVSGLPVAKFGHDSSLRVGEEVVAVGSPLGLSNTVTSGIVSSLNRPVCTQNCSGGNGGGTATVLDAIQTDAAINPGNSGGPLVNLAGEVVGVNSAIATVDQQPQGGQAGNIGVGFAIPIDEAQRVIAELQQTGHATHAVVGVSVTDSLDATLNTPNGAQVVSVTSGGPAAKAGIAVKDVIVKFAGRTVVDADSLIAATHAAAPDSTVAVTVVRAGQQQTFQVTLGSASSG